MITTIFTHRAWTALVLASLVLLSTRPLQADDWPQYRGPQYLGVSTEKGWVAQFPKEGPKPLWKASVGVGASSMTTSGGRVFTMGNVNNEDVVYCLDAKSGKEIWRHQYACPLGARQFEGGPAGTPTIADGRVYTLSWQGDLFCLNAADGKVVWSKNLPKDFGGQKPNWGYAGSPLAYGKHVIVDAGGTQGSTVVLNAADGTLVWQAGKDDAGYASPVVFPLNNVKTLLMFKARDIVGLDATNGAELWRHGWKTSYDVNAATPIVAGNRVFISSGYGTGGVALDIKDHEAAVAWQNKNMCNHFNSCTLWQGHLYGVNGNAGPNAPLNCLDWATGDVKWSEPSVKGGSLMIADGKLIVLSETGELIIAPATPAKFEALARAKVLDGRCWVAPVLSDGQIYCRNNQGTLVCLDVSGQ